MADAKQVTPLSLEIGLEPFGVLILQFQKPNQDWKEADVAFESGK